MKDCDGARRYRGSHTATFARRRRLTEEAQHLGLVLDEKVEDAAQAANFCLDMFEACSNCPLDGVNTKLHLLDVPANGSKAHFHFRLKPGKIALGRHLAAHRFNFATDI